MQADAQLIRFISSFDVENDSEARVLAVMMEQGGQMQLLESMNNIQIPRDEQGKYIGLFGHVLNTREPFYGNRPDEMEEPTGGSPQHLQVKKFLAVPVYSARGWSARWQPSARKQTTANSI